MNKKLIFFDVDGTLISYKNDPHIPKETFEAILRLQENGHIIAIATGRSYQLLNDVLKGLPIAYYIVNNGAQIRTDNEIIYEKKTGVRISKKIKLALLNTNLNIFAFDGEHVYTHNISEESKSFVENESKRKDYMKPLQDLNTALLSISAYGDTDELSAFLNNIKTIDFKKAQNDIAPKGISKGFAIKKLAKHLGLCIRDTITVGDGMNDIEMIKVAGIGIAVENACQELKDVADFVTEDIDTGGILKIFEKLELI